MSNYITINTRKGDFRARITARDDSWQDAANRAVRRAFGRSAWPWAWIVDGQQVDRDGTVRAITYRAMVAGREQRGGGHPVLGYASLTLTAEA